MKLSVVLSGGGAVGLGHVAVLQALDEMGIVPVAIAGTSMGALLGGAYSAGMRAKDIHAHITSLSTQSGAKVMKFLWNRPGALTEMTGTLPARRAVEFAWPDGLPTRLEDFSTPFTAVATDFYAHRPTFFPNGAVTDVLAASIAIPGIFRPVQIDGRVYVDGGVTNNLPVEAVPADTVILAVNAATQPPAPPASGKLPGPLETAVGSMNIMMQSMLHQEVAKRPGTILIEPTSRAYGPLEFRKAVQILQATEPTRDDTKRLLSKALEQHDAG